jgi:hypothetical protein
MPEAEPPRALGLREQTREIPILFNQFGPQRSRSVVRKPYFATESNQIRNG